MIVPLKNKQSGCFRMQQLEELLMATLEGVPRDVFGAPAYAISYTVPNYPWKSWF